MNLDSLFDEVKENEIKQATEKTTSFVKFSEDPRFIQFKAGNTYQFRLLYYVDDPEKRKTPFIAKYTHNHWDDDAEFDKLKTVTCPTSEYILHNNGFSKCPICKATRKFYKDKEEGSSTAEELYDQYRRKFHGYALVYVVNDPTNEENNGTIKLMHFGITIHKWLKLQIFGIDEKGNLVDDETIGKGAFDLKDGYNLKITVSKKGEYNDYLCEFARKSSAINISEKDIAAAATELKFDEEYTTFSSDEELNTFYKECVLAEEVNSSTKDEIDLGEEDEENKEDDIPMDFDKNGKAKKEEAPEETPEDEPEEPAEEKTEDLGTDDGDIDIDNILKKVKK